MVCLNQTNLVNPMLRTTECQILGLNSKKFIVSDLCRVVHRSSNSPGYLCSTLDLGTKAALCRHSTIPNQGLHYLHSKETLENLKSGLPHLSQKWHTPLPLTFLGQHQFHGLSWLQGELGHGVVYRRKGQNQEAGFVEFLIIIFATWSLEVSIKWFVTLQKLYLRTT